MTSLHTYDTPDADDIIGRNLTRDNGARRFDQHRRVIDQYWACWKREYLTSLREHHKTGGTTEQTIRVGDVVIVHDEFSSRLRWKMGVVQELIPCNDGLSSAAHVKTANGLLTRPKDKLYSIKLNVMDNS